MLTNVELVSDYNFSLSLDIGDDSTGYFIDDIEGLDFIKATTSSKKVPNIDGEVYSGFATKDIRDINVKLAYEPNEGNPTVKSLRDALYRGFPPGSNITLRFTDSEMPEILFIEGVVEDIDSPLFSPTPTATISIRCFYPLFKNESRKSLFLASTNNATYTPIDYRGTAPTGFDLSMTVERNIAGFELYVSNTFYTYIFRYTLPAYPVSIIDITTTPGKRSVTLSGFGGNPNVAHAISPDSVWPLLHPGPNAIRIDIPGAPVAYSMNYWELYGGL